MAISKPQLPPRSGYVEAEVNGKRVYRPIVPASQDPSADEILDTLLGVETDEQTANG